MNGAAKIWFSDWMAPFCHTISKRKKILTLVVYSVAMWQMQFVNAFSRFLLKVYWMRQSAVLRILQRTSSSLIKKKISGGILKLDSEETDIYMFCILSSWVYCTIHLSSVRLGEWHLLHQYMNCLDKICQLF